MTNVQWAGATDNGLMCGDTAYTAAFTIEIKPDKDAKYTTGTINATVNGGSTGVSVTRASDTQVRVIYTLAAGGAPALGVTNFTIHTSVPKVGVALNRNASTSGSSNVEVTSVEWTGERDSVGRVKTDTAYTLTLNVKIKDKNNAVFSPRGVTPYINNTDTPATSTRLSDTTGIVTYTSPIISSAEREAEQNAKQDTITAQEHADELVRRWSLAEAEAARPQNNPITIVVNESALDMDRFSRILPNIDTGAYWKGWESKDRGTPITNFLGGVGAVFTTLDGKTVPINDENERRVTRVVYDFYWPIDFSLAWYPNVTEFWLSPQCDIEGILNNIAHDYFGGDGDHRQFYTYNHTLFIPDSVYPSGPPAYLGDIIPGCRVMLYSGSDVYAAVKKGASAARDWCTNYSYTAQILTPDRWYSDISCYDGTRYYYSCVRCGKCEYSPKVDAHKTGQFTVGQWTETWFENYAKPAIRETTAAYYKNYIDKHIIPNIGKIKLDKLTTLDIQRFYNKAKSKGRVKRYEGMKDLSLSAKTIRGLHAMLRQCLEQAVQERLIPFNPAAGCKLPPKEKKEMRTLPAEKISAYLAAAEEHGVLPMFYLELTTGLRRGELVALLWDDLDLEKQTLTVSKSAGRINGEVKVTQPKTANSVRTIYLPKETVDLLIQEHAKHPGNPVMFPSPVIGKFYGPDCLGRLHKTLLKKAGITENIPFHGLRHTFATLAIQQGVDAKTVSSILGHYSAGFTLDAYTHVTGKMQKDAAQRMGSFMAQQAE